MFSYYQYYLWMELYAGTVPANNTLFAGTILPCSGKLHLICQNYFALFRQITPYLLDLIFFRFSFFSLLYGTPAPTSERQHPEAWPASTYGHLRGVSLKIVLANKVLFARTVPANNLFV